MILVIVNTEKDECGRDNLIVSHGIDLNDDKVIILPQVHPSLINARFDYEIGEYTLQK